MREMLVPLPAAFSDLEFVGCEAVRVSASEIESPDWEGRRVEYWHAATETAWLVREAASRYHESPAQRLSALVERICQARGSEAHCCGAMDLRVRSEDGTLSDLIQADQTVYLDPLVNLPRGAQLVVGEDAYPDVVLEVDNTTDVRPGKLLAYEAWGFPELWVETPEHASPSRPPGLGPELRIYLLEAGRYRVSAASRALPGWRAEEIHRALNETVVSEETAAVLWRVGRALGEPEGTRPEDDYLLRKVGNRARAAMVRAILEQRGIPVSEDKILAAVHRASPEAVAEAALAALSEADFLARLG